MRTPLERQMILPSGWGAKVDTTRDWADDGNYRPDCHVLHYGGGANPAGTAPFSQESESAVLRAWERWHMRVGSNGYPVMRSIAYNYGIGQTGNIFYLRGPKHSNGGHYGSINRTSRAVVFILGGDQEPSIQARRAFARLWLEEPFGGKVWGHRDVGQTSCPGSWLYSWLNREGYVTDLAVHSQGDYAPVVQSVKVRLHRLGYRILPGYSPRFNARLRRQIQRFQTRHGLTPDGVVGPQTLRAMGGLLGEVFPDDHSEEPAG